MRTSRISSGMPARRRQGPLARGPPTSGGVPTVPPGEARTLRGRGGLLRATDCVGGPSGPRRKSGRPVRPPSGRRASNRAVGASRCALGAATLPRANRSWWPRAAVESALSRAGARPLQCQQGIMYLEGVSAPFCRPAFVALLGRRPRASMASPPSGPRGPQAGRHLVTDPIDDPDFRPPTTPSGFWRSRHRVPPELVRPRSEGLPGQLDSCMYNLSTSNDFLLDFHPQRPGVFSPRRDSGHGFKSARSWERSSWIAGRASRATGGRPSSPTPLSSRRARGPDCSDRRRHTTRAASAPRSPRRHARSPRGPRRCVDRGRSRVRDAAGGGGESRG